MIEREVKGSKDGDLTESNAGNKGGTEERRFRAESTGNQTNTTKNRRTEKLMRKKFNGKERLEVDRDKRRRSGAKINGKKQKSTANRTSDAKNRRKGERKRILRRQKEIWQGNRRKETEIDGKNRREGFEDGKRRRTTPQIDRDLTEIGNKRQIGRAHV